MNYRQSPNSSKNRWITIGLVGALIIALGFVGWAIAASRQTAPPKQAVATEPTTPPPAPPPPPPKYNCPLDGSEAATKADTQKRPIVVQIDNAPAARNQSGLSQADIVYEYMAEGEITRFSAVFACHDADTVGPVRSARLIDLELVPEYQALLSNSGASQGTAAELSAASDYVPNIDDARAPDVYWRVHDRYAPDNLMTSTDGIRQAAAAAGLSTEADVNGGPTFKGDSPPAAGAALKSISVPYSPYADVSYQYDPGANAWLRFIGGKPHIDTLNGKQIEAKNVIIQYVQVTQTNIKEDSNNYGLSFQLTGSGKVLVFRDGQVVSGTWQRTARDAPTTYYDAQNRPIALNVGQTWVQVVPADFQASWS